MKRVGILTYHHAINYGATLQGYALWQTVRRQGYDVEFIDYRPIKAVKTYLVNRHFLRNLAKSWKIDRFLHSHAKLSNKKIYFKGRLGQGITQYHAVISGSDEVWNINSFRGFDASYFLDFVPETTQKISYAASFGSTKSLGGHQDAISKLITQFANVSVRDSNSLDLIQKECGVKAERVLDPTFLADYSQFMSSEKFDQPYLLIYSFALTPEEETLIQFLAQSKGLEIVSVGFHNKVANKNLVNASMEEWLNYFNQASYVVTSFYHGTIFSIIFKKPFTVLSRGDKSIKVTDLLSYLRLSDRLFSASTPSNQPQKELLELDYSPAYEILPTSISSSRTFLTEALNA